MGARAAQPSGSVHTADISVTTGAKATTAAHERTRAAIVEAAVDVLAANPDAAKLDAVAIAAGVSRATLYRYFPSRDQLVHALVEAAYQEVIERVRDAQIDDVPFEEALVRVARAAALTGNHFVVLQHEPPVALDYLDDEFEATMLRFFERGQAEGVLRRDRPTAWLRTVYRAIVVEAIRYGAVAELGVEETATLITSQFLSGACASPA